jgi:hypothetical protein
VLLQVGPQTEVKKPKPLSSFVQVCFAIQSIDVTMPPLLCLPAEEES